VDKLGERLKQLRKRRVMTQEALSQSSGVTEATISRIEKGRTGPTRQSTVIKLAGALGVEPSYLLFGDGDQDEGKELAAA